MLIPMFVSSKFEWLIFCGWTRSVVSGAIEFSTKKKVIKRRYSSNIFLGKSRKTLNTFVKMPLGLIFGGGNACASITRWLHHDINTKVQVYLGQLRMQ